MTQFIPKFRTTWFFNHHSQKWTTGPDTIDKKAFHACGKFMIGNSTVLVVAGGTYISSVEFLLLNDQNWIPGLHTTLWSEVICVYWHNSFSGPTLPFYPSRNIN